MHKSEPRGQAGCLSLSLSWIFRNFAQSAYLFPVIISLPQPLRYPNKYLHKKSVNRPLCSRTQGRFLLSFLFSIWSLVVTGQTFMLGEGGAVRNNVCSGTFVDPGGFDDYPAEQNLTQTFCASSGQCLQLSLTEFDTEFNFDILKVFDGSSMASELLFSFSGTNPPNTVITSTTASGGCLTVNFVSDGFNQKSGFKGTFSCVSCPVAPEVLVLGEGGSGSTETCSAILRDPGGNNDYGNDLNVVQTICSGSPGSCLKVSFVEFETERGKDFLRIYEGQSTTGKMLAEYSGPLIPLPIQGSTDGGGCLTFSFTSNQTFVRSGFKASISCEPCKPPVTEYVLGQAGRITACEGVILDPGGNSFIPPNQHVQQTFCSGSGQCLQLEFADFDLEKELDIIKVYDGADQFAEQIAEYSGQDIPPVITGSTNSGGCLTVAFLSNASGFNTGFRAKVSCVPCIPPPQNVVLGRGGATVVSCGGILLDPGSYGSYDNNQSVTQTICSGTAQCVRLTFTDFNTETSVDNLKIYDGPTTDVNTLLGVFSGANKPMPVESSVQSGGCLTLQFTTNASGVKSGFSAIISCKPCVDPYPIPTGKCQDARGFCTDDGTIDFPAGTNVTSPFGTSQVGCLVSTPNPAWYYMNVSRSGPINIHILGSDDGGLTATNDVDFICWGPFATREEICNLATDLTYANDPANIIDCSYSPDPTESCEIPNAILGEWYMLLLTNYSNRPANIYFKQSNASVPGSGQTNCDLFCDIEINATAGSCDPSTNTYSLSGQLEITNPPGSGNLVITNSSGGMLVIPAPFSSPIPFAFSDLASDGALNQVTAYFSENTTCSAAMSYTAPATCSVCPVTITQSGTFCTGASFGLSASLAAGATYSWTGPNGYTSTNRELSFNPATTNMSGLYMVTLTNVGISCQSKATVNIQVNQTPLAPVLAVNNPVCEGTPANFTAQTSAMPGASYSWTGPNGFSSVLQNPSLAGVLPSQAGAYSCVVAANGCSSLPATVNLLVNPYPGTPVPANDGPHCSGSDLKLSVGNIPGATFEWQGPLDFESNVQNPVVSNASASNSGIYRVRARLNGCFSQYATTNAIIYPKPPLPIVYHASPYCSGDEVNLSGPPSNSGAPAQYTWTGPGGFSANSRSVLIPAIAVGQQGDYSLVVSENACNSDKLTFPIEVKPRPQANAGADVTSCSGATVSIGAPGVSGLAYIWTPVTGLSDPSIANPEVNLNNSGSSSRQEVYTLLVEENGCSSSDQVTVTVAAQPVASFPTPNSQCFDGNAFKFTANGNFSPLASFKWDFGDWATPSTSTAQNPTGIHFGATGTHPVRFQIDEQGCLSNVYTAEITIYPMPVANFDVDIMKGCAPQVMRFTNLSTSEEPIKTWLWDFGNQRASQLQNPGPVTYDLPGNFTVSLKVSTEKGCTDTYEIPGLVRIYPTPKAGFTLLPFETEIIRPVIEVEDLSKGASKWTYTIEGLPDTITKSEFNYTFKDTGRFVIRQTVRNAFDCYASSEQTAHIKLGYRLYIPSAFSPNDDGNNDRFRVYGEGILNARIEIFSRWGELLYVSYDYENGWDGITKLGVKAVPGNVYFYRIYVQDKYGVHWSYQGTVTALK